MKKLLIFAMLIVSLATIANAMTLNQVTIGDDDQDRVHDVTGTLRVTNTDNSTDLTNVALSSSAPSSYNVRFSGPGTVAAGTTESYTVTIDIPDDHDSVDDDLDEAALKVGQITVTGDLGASTDQGSADLYVQAVNKLRIDKVRVVCDTKSKSVDDGDSVDDILPGQECTVEINVENNFDDSSDNGEKIVDVEFNSMRFTIDSSNSDVDVDMDDDFDDLGPAENDDATATIEVDEEADRDADIDLEVYAIDENGAKHGEKLSFQLEVKRLTHDVQISQVQVSPQSLDNCMTDSVRVTVNVKNLGKRDEDSAAVEISVPNLNFVKKEDAFELDENDGRSVVFNIPLDEDTDSGVYTVEIRTFYDTIAPSNQGQAEFTITQCAEEEEDEPEVIIVRNDTSDTDTAAEPPISPSAGSAQKAPTRSTTSNTLYVTLLIGLNVLLLAAIVVVVVFFTQKKK